MSEGSGVAQTRQQSTKTLFDRFAGRCSEFVSGAPFSILAAVFKKRERHGEYVVDSFPVPVCDNIRIRRSRLYEGERFRGYVASKRRYFDGLRVHMLLTAEGGEPVEFFLEAGSTNDNPVFEGFELDLPAGSVIYADKRYNDYHYEDLLKEDAAIEMKLLRKKTSKRPFAPYVEYIQQRMRKRMETSDRTHTRFFGTRMIPYRQLTARLLEVELQARNATVAPSGRNGGGELGTARPRGPGCYERSAVRIGTRRTPQGR